MFLILNKVYNKKIKITNTYIGYSTMLIYYI